MPDRGLALQAPTRWDDVRALWARATYSPASTACWSWALDVLEAALGPKWIFQCWNRGGLPPELAGAGRLDSFLRLLTLAAQLRLLEEHPGVGRARRALRSDPTSSQLMAARSVFALASMGLRAGYEPTLERIGPGDTPSDLVLRLGDIELCVEAKTLRRPDASIEITAWLDTLTPLLMTSLTSCNVEIVGQALEPLDREATLQLADRLHTAARLVAAGGITPPIRAGRNDFEVHPAGPEGPRSRIASPPADLWRRTASRIRHAIEQAQTSGANWVVIESLDGMWQLTPWASMPPADRSLQLAQAAEALIPDNSSIRGIVFTDGAATQDLSTADLSVQPGPRSRALIRRINYTRSRQSVIIARHADEPHVEVWDELLDAEAGWTRWAIGRLDLPMAPELELVTGSPAPM